MKKYCTILAFTLITLIPAKAIEVISVDTYTPSNLNKSHLHDTKLIYSTENENRTAIYSLNDDTEITSFNGSITEINNLATNEFVFYEDANDDNLNTHIIQINSDNSINNLGKIDCKVAEVISMNNNLYAFCSYEDEEYPSPVDSVYKISINQEPQLIIDNRKNTVTMITSDDRAIYFLAYNLSKKDYSIMQINSTGESRKIWDLDSSSIEIIKPIGDSLIVQEGVSIYKLNNIKSGTISKESISKIKNNSCSYATTLNKGNQIFFFESCSTLNFPHSITTTYNSYIYSYNPTSSKFNKLYQDNKLNHGSKLFLSHNNTVSIGFFDFDYSSANINYKLMTNVGNKFKVNYEETGKRSYYEHLANLANTSLFSSYDEVYEIKDGAKSLVLSLDDYNNSGCLSLIESSEFDEENSILYLLIQENSEAVTCDFDRKILKVQF